MAAESGRVVVGVPVAHLMAAGPLPWLQGTPLALEEGPVRSQRGGREPGREGARVWLGAVPRSG